MHRYIVCPKKRKKGETHIGMTEKGRAGWQEEGRKEEEKEKRSREKKEWRERGKRLVKESKIPVGMYLLQKSSTPLAKVRTPY